MIDVRDNWRILLLVVLCIIAGLALFGPLAAGDGDQLGDDNETAAFVSTATTISDDAGQFTQEVPTGEYELQVNDLAYEPYTTNATVETDETTEVAISLDPAATGTIEGTVQANGEPAGDVTVQFRSSETGALVATTDSAADGTYDIGLPGGEYDVVVDEVEYSPFDTEVTVETGETTTVDIDLTALSTGTVEGTVTGDGTPVADTDVDFVDPDTGDVLTTVTTDEDGTYTTPVPEGEHDIRVTAFGYEEFRTNVSVTADEPTTADIDLTALDGGTVEGTVTGDGDPAGDVELEFRDPATGTVLTTAVTDDDGTYAIDLPADQYRLVVDDVRYETLERDVVVTADETTAADVELTPQDTGTIEGTVTDADGNELSGIEVDIGVREEPLGGLDDEEVFSDPTNLQYGLELSGGSRLRGQLVGMTVDQAQIHQDDRTDVERTVAEELGLDPIDVTVRQTDAETASVEVFTRVTEQQIVDALGAAGVQIDTGDVRGGVTEDTRDRAVTVLENRINEVGLAGGSVSTVSQPGSSEHFLVVEAPGVDRTELRELIGDPGRVQIIATYPDRSDGEVTYEREEILVEEDFDRIGTADPGGGGVDPHVPVTLSADAADRFIESTNRLGFNSGEGVENCRWRENPDDPGYCLLTVVDGEAVYGASMSGDFADTLRNNPDGFRASPDFQMNTLSFSEAQDLRVNLEAGSLPTELDIQTETFISPSLAQLFKPLAALTALAAWLMVCAVVFYWYRDIRVAIPMLVTAFAEVWLLLGFASAVGLAMDLSHIAGLIAVIGTGLDDLIIMADEILQRKQNVKTGRIFQNRFRKAFWIIGMAAATTIIAMSPLAVMSLGDLRGFAIVTIVGVLIGVGITRPAYGDILRHLMLDDVKRK